MPYSRMTAAAHGNSSTKEKAETIPGFSPPVQSMPTSKDWAKSKILSPFRTLQEVSSLAIITYLNARDLVSHPKPARFYNPA